MNPPLTVDEELLHRTHRGTGQDPHTTLFHGTKCGRVSPENHSSRVRQSSLFCLSGTGRGCAAQQSLGTDVFVNFRPLDTVAASGNLLIAALLGGGLEQPWIPGERDRDGAAVFEAHAQRALIEGNIDDSLICRGLIPH